MEHKKPLFALGQTVATPAALAALREAGQDASEFITRHVTGDWGDLDAEDAAMNNESVKNENDPEKRNRILSAYKLANDEKIWIITEQDRSCSTILKPEDY